MANPKILTSIAESLQDRSVSVINVLKSGSEMSVTNKFVRTFRTISHQPPQHVWRKPPPKTAIPKVDDWSNGLRESLLTKLSNRSKSTTTIGGLRCMGSDLGNARFNSDNSNKGYNGIVKAQDFGSTYNKKELRETQSTMECDKFTESQEAPLGLKEGDNQKTKEPEENNWATMVQKTIDLNMNDIPGINSSGERKNLSMDINVILKIKPYESKSKIGFQEIAEKKKMERIIEEEKSAKEAIRLCNEETATVKNQPRGDKMCEEKEYENNSYANEFTEIKCNEEITKKLLSEDLLVQELGMIYTYHKIQGGSKSSPLSKNDENMSEDLVQNVSKIKEFYMESLENNKELGEMEYDEGDSIGVQEDAPSTTTTQNNSSNVGSTTDYTSATQSTTDAPIAVGTCSPPISSRRFNSFLNDTSKRTFATSSLALKEKKEKKEDCDKARTLPCLKASNLSNVKNESAGNKAVCEKFCMPCCKPARDPPECFYPYHKPPCKKYKPPRPSFSECKQIFPLKQITPCECVPSRGSSCKKSKESAKCSK